MMPARSGRSAATGFGQELAGETDGRGRGCAAVAAMPQPNINQQANAATTRIARIPLDRRRAALPPHRAPPCSGPCSGPTRRAGVTGLTSPGCLQERDIRRQSAGAGSTRAPGRRARRLKASVEASERVSEPRCERCTRVTSISAHSSMERGARTSSPRRGFATSSSASTNTVLLSATSLSAGSAQDPATYTKILTAPMLRQRRLRVKRLLVGPRQVRHPVC